MPAIHHLLDDTQRLYIPQRFVAEYGELWPVGQTDRAVIAQGPNTRGYWDAWQHVLDTATFTDDDGHTWRIHQDQGVVTYCDALLSDAERDRYQLPEEQAQ